jgi:ABC-type multidrug transport system permease subunit
MPETAGAPARHPQPKPGPVRPPNPVLELTLARIREFVREPEALFWVFVFPVLLAFALGIAFRNQAPEKLRVAVETTTPDVGRVVTLLSRSSDLQVLELSPEAAAQALRTGKVDLVVLQEPGSPYAFRYDPTRPQSRLARLRADDALERGLGRKDLAEIREEKVIEPGARYIDFLIPGLIGLNLMGSGMWGIGFAVVQARTKKLLKRFAATPMRRSHYLLSFMLSRLVFLVPEVAALVGFGWIVFQVEVRGSLIALTVVSLLGSFTFAGLGLLLAARTKTIEAVSGWMNFVMLPMWLLSGTFFSYSRFPEFLQPAIRALPLTALNDALRAVMNEGLALSQSWLEILVLCFWAGVSFGLALRLFRWQ